MTPYLLQVVGALLFTLSGLATSANLRRSRSLHTGEATSRCPIQPMNLESGKWFDDPWDRNMGCRIDINHACYPEGLSEEEANAACQQWYAENCGSTADDGTYAEAYAASLEDHPGLCRIRLRHPDGWEEVNYHPYTATMASDSDNHVLPNNEYFNGCKVNYLLHPPAYSEEFGCEWFINDYCPELNADDFIIAVSEREDVNGRRVCGMARKDAPDSEPEPEPEPSPTPAPSPSPSAEPSEEECSYGAVTIGMYTCMESTDHEIDQIYPSPWIEESFVPIEGVQMTKFGGIRVYRQGDPEYGTQEGNLLPVKPYAVYSGDDVEAFKDWFSTAESNFLQYTASKVTCILCMHAYVYCGRGPDQRELFLLCLRVWIVKRWKGSPRGITMSLCMILRSPTPVMIPTVLSLGK